MSSYGFKFGHKWYEIHIEPRRRSYVAQVVEVDVATGDVVRDIPIDLVERDEQAALARARAYLTKYAGKQGEPFIPRSRRP